METKTSTGDLMEDSKRWEEKHHQIKGREALSNWVKYAPKCLGTPEKQVHVALQIVNSRKMKVPPSLN